MLLPYLRATVAATSVACLVGLASAQGVSQDAAYLQFFELPEAQNDFTGLHSFNSEVPLSDTLPTQYQIGQGFAGSQANGSSGNRSANANEEPVKIPEPLLFDMVRPLGPKKGEFEFNTLAIFPWRTRTPGNAEGDPFGPGPTTKDRGGIEWAPEVEIALSDRFAIEFELPFEGSTLEELKVGLQWTFGTAFNNRYIHGAQVLIEPTPEFETWSSTILYIGGIRIDETWSTLFMFGGRMDLEGSNNFGTFERLFNASVFAELTDWLTLGVEANVASKNDGSSNFILVPQTHIELTDCFELQSGVGLGTAADGYELSAIIRLIYAR